MPFTAPEIVLIIGAFGAIIVQIIKEWRTNTAIRENTAITAQTLVKTAVIEGHVNSEKAGYEERMKSRDEEVASLRRQLVAAEGRAGLLAQARAVETSQQPGTAPAPKE